MKKLSTWIILFLSFYSITSSLAQSSLWGLTSAGGFSNGVVFGINTGSNAISTQTALLNNAGAAPQLIKLLEVGGKLYGTTNSGGTGGVLFEYNFATNIYVPKLSFSGASGAYPGSNSQGPLMLASSGKVYGMTRSGGSNNGGVLFEYAPSTNGYSVLVNFQANSFPSGSLFETAGGRFIGMTRGPSNGVLFEYIPGSGTTTLVAFTGSTGLVMGNAPMGSVIEGTTNVVYGLTQSGGTNNDGVIFKYNLSMSSYSVVTSFTSATTGKNPMGTLVKAANGKLYGVTSAGGGNGFGTLFELDPSTDTFTKLADFTGSGTGNGNGSQCTLLEVSGKLYGTTRFGGANNGGVIFEYDISGNTLTKKIDLALATGNTPVGSLMLASNGNIYGTTTGGGSASQGVIFEYVISSNTYTKKIDLNSTQGGGFMGSLTLGTNNKFYGVFRTGGAQNLGGVFEYDYANNVYALKASLSSVLGSLPMGSFVMAGNGKFYALTSAGGSSGNGSIVEYTQGGTSVTKKIDLTGTSGAAMGSMPIATMIEAGGKLYGTTSTGGSNDLGTIFEYDYVNNVYTKKVDFNGTLAPTGSNPKGIMALASNGKLYGVTETGGSSGLGVLYEYDYSLNSYTTKINFNGSSLGSAPVGGLISATNGLLYGMTSDGGSNGLGCLFSYNPSNNTLTKLYDFSSSSGHTPFGALRQAANGNLYGMTSAGGANGFGTIFEYNITSTTFTKLVDFNQTNGATPMYTQLAEICIKPTIAGAISSTSSAICEGTGASTSFSIATIANATSYSWTPPAGVAILTGSASNAPTFSLAGLTSGNFTMNASGINVCGTGTASAITITVNPNPNISASSGSICSGKSFTITPSGASSYTYSSGSAIVSPTINTNYSVSGTSSLGCVSLAPAILTVSVAALPTVAAASGSICAGQSFTLAGTGANTYTYSGGQVVSPANTTTYGVTGTGTNGCVSGNTAVATVTVFALPVITVNSGSICSGKTFTILPGGASTYTISGGSAVVSPSATTYYTVTGTSTAGCVSSVSAISGVSVSILPTIAVSNGTICNGQTFTINPTGASSYTISGGSFVVNPSTTTSYSITGTSIVGCVGANTAVASVVVNTVPIITVNSGTICNGTSFVMTPSGASNYTYSSGSATVSPTANSSYTVIGMSPAGCVSTLAATSNVTVFARPVIAVNSGSICANSSFTMSPSGAISYTYSSGTAIVSPTSTSSYSVSGTSTAGCVSATPAIANVSVVARPIITVNNGTICNGQSFTITPGGANTYTISSGSFVVNPTSNTSYSITGTSAVGCISSNTAVSSVVVNTVPIISVSNGSICNGNIFVLSPSGAASYTYSSGSATVFPSTTTSYTISGTSPAGCTSTTNAVATVTVHALPVVSVNSGSICSGQSFTLSPSGAASYFYSSGSAIVSPTITSSYSVIGTSSAGCAAAAPAVSNVTVVALPVVSANSGTICNGQSFTITPTGAASYTITGGNFVVSPGSTSTYSITGASAVGCISSNTAVANVTVFALPVISASSGTICNGQSYVIVPSGASTYTYSGGSSTVSPSSTTQYSVSGTSTAGCLSAAPAIVNVTVYALPVISVNSGSICNGASFTMNPSGANTYTFSGGNAVVSPNTTTAYSVTGTSTAGCISAAPAISNVTVIALPVVAASSGSICNGQVYTIVPSGASTYTITGGSFAVSPSSTSNYSITGTSAVGCVSSNTAVSTVTVYALPVISANSGTICDGNSFVITPSGANTYTITGGTNTVSPNTTTSYSITGTSTAGCISAGPAVSTVSVFARPVISVNSGSICFGDSFTLTPGGASTYTITGGNSIVSPTITSSYTVSGTSTAGCTSTTSAVANVSVIALPVVSINSGSICAGESFTLVPSGAAGYTITGGNYVVTPAFTTNYSLTGISAVGCLSSNTAVATVTVNALPIISVNSGTICDGNSFIIIANGAASYTYSGGSNTVAPNVTTSYSVIGQSTAGCLSAGPAISTVTVYALPQLTVNSGSICAGSFFTITPSGAVSYTISGGTALVSPSVNTSYTVMGTSAEGCLSNPATTVNVVVNPLPILSALNGTICLGDVFTPTVSGALSYTYSSGTNTMSPTSTTGYSVSGTDANGCVSGQTQFIVVVNPLPTLGATGNFSICIGETATVIPSGAVNYTWSVPTGTDLVVSPTVSTSYTVTGEGANGCFNTYTVPITVNMLPTVSVAGGAICPGNSFTFAPTGAVSYTYSTNGPIVSPSVSTTYTIIGSSPEGCVSVPVTASVDVVSTLTVNVTGNKPICSGSSYVLIANGGATYTWNTGAGSFTTPVLTGSLISSGTFTVIAASGSCSDTTLVNVLVNALPTVAVTGPTVACNDEPFTLVVSGANTYTWTAPKSNSTSIVLTQTTTSVYEVKGTDSNGCSATVTYTVESQDCTGIVENGTQPLLNLYPNPSNGLFLIQSDRAVAYQVFDNKGLLVDSGNFTEGLHEINLQPFAKGMYSVILTTNQFRRSYKVISQ